jgi:transcription initiation factor TFIIE subunit alpha
MEIENKTNDEIPENLKRLVRIMLRAFYSFEHCLIIDILIRNRCIKEEDLISLSKFDKKQLRAILATIKMEKILKSKTLAEPTPGAEPDENGVVPKTKYVYYFINYRKGEFN